MYYLYIFADASGRTALHLHASHGRAFGTSCLLHQGADVNRQTDDSGSTPLHFAAGKHRTSVVRALLEHLRTTGRDDILDAQDNDGKWS